MKLLLYLWFCVESVAVAVAVAMVCLLNCLPLFPLLDSLSFSSFLSIFLVFPPPSLYSFHKQKRAGNSIPTRRRRHRHTEKRERWENESKWSIGGDEEWQAGQYLRQGTCCPVRTAYIRLHSKVR